MCSEGYVILISFSPYSNPVRQIKSLSTLHTRKPCHRELVWQLDHAAHNERRQEWNPVKRLQDSPCAVPPPSRSLWSLAVWMPLGPGTGQALPPYLHSFQLRTSAPQLDQAPHCPAHSRWTPTSGLCLYCFSRSGMPSLLLLLLINIHYYTILHLPNLFLLPAFSPHLSLSCWRSVHLLFNQRSVSIGVACSLSVQVANDLKAGTERAQHRSVTAAWIYNIPCGHTVSKINAAYRPGVSL